jgi:RNA polymerase-binding protein DksA
MRKRESERYKKVLLAVRAKLLGDSASVEKNAIANKRSESAGDLSAMPIHFADIGTDTFNQEFALDVLESKNDLLAEINTALDRISEGSYGKCEECDKNISTQRLKALPYARLCIGCQQDEERQATT